MKTAAVLVVLSIALQSTPAQLIQPAEAESAEEFDAWLQYRSPATLAEAQRNVTHFESQWPQSKLLAGLHHAVMDFEVAAGRASAAVEAAERALRAIPTYLPALLVVAEYGPQPAERLALARQVLTNYPPPPGLPLLAWRKVRNKWQARIHELEGVQAARRQDLPGALRSLHRAVEYDQTNASAWLRLARIYRTQGEEALAKSAYAQAITHGAGPLRAQAEKEKTNARNAR